MAAAVYQRNAAPTIDPPVASEAVSVSSFFGGDAVGFPAFARCACIFAGRAFLIF